MRYHGVDFAGCVAGLGAEDAVVRESSSGIFWWAERQQNRDESGIVRSEPKLAADSHHVPEGTRSCQGGSLPDSLRYGSRPQDFHDHGAIEGALPRES